MSGLVIIVWSVAYPFLYGLLISRLFGIKKPLDQWILVCLQISSMVLGLIFMTIFASFAVNIGMGSHEAAFPFLSLASLFVPMFVYHGLVWQLLLKDRKFNGFLISLICNAIYASPILLISVMDTLHLNTLFKF